MAGSILVDAGFLIALLSVRDTNHDWAVAQAARFPPPWKTCEAALSEAFHLLGASGVNALAALLRRRALVCDFPLGENVEEVAALMEKYSNVPMSLADACLVRMTEVLPDPIVLTCDTDFQIYRRHGRKVVPSVMPD
jgi:predicted nucleic acid-binding protein